MPSFRASARRTGPKHQVTTRGSMSHRWRTEPGEREDESAASSTTGWHHGGASRPPWAVSSNRKLSLGSPDIGAARAGPRTSPQSILGPGVVTAAQGSGAPKTWPVMWGPAYPDVWFESTWSRGSREIDADRSRRVEESSSERSITARGRARAPPARLDPESRRGPRADAVFEGGYGGSGTAAAPVSGSTRSSKMTKGRVAGTTATTGPARRRRS